MSPIPYDKYYIPGGIDTARLGCALIVPYVHGMLRDETMAAVQHSGAPFFTFALEQNDPYQYAELFRQVWDWHVDTVWIEQDMVPTVVQIKDLLYCNRDWCTIKYHQGGGMYTTGIGFAKISKQIKDIWPVAGANIAADPRGKDRAVKWPSLNEAVENHLGRLGVELHVHEGQVPHLHYPESEHE